MIWAHLETEIEPNCGNMCFHRINIKPDYPAGGIIELENFKNTPRRKVDCG